MKTRNVGVVLDEGVAMEVDVVVVDVVTISEVCEDEPTLVVEGSGEGEED